MFIKLFPYIYTLLPCDKEGLIKIVVDIDDDVVVGSGVNIWARKLVIDEDDLLGDTQRGSSAIGYIPCVMEIRVLGSNQTSQ